jgi:hypothetical protein
MHIFSIFGRLYNIDCETDMHIFDFYHINSQFIVYAFAPGTFIAGYFLNLFLFKL